MWILDSTWNFTQSCLGSQGGVLDTGSASWAPSQPRAPLLDRLWGEPHSGETGTGMYPWHVGRPRQHLVEPEWGEISPRGFLGILWGFLISLVEGTRLFSLFMAQPVGWRGSRGGIISHPDRWQGSDGPQHHPTAPLGFTPADAWPVAKFPTEAQPQHVGSGRSRRAPVNKQKGLFQPLEAIPASLSQPWDNGGGRGVMEERPGTAGMAWKSH